jgi:hypothetical protein
MGRPKLELEGKVFGKLTVVSFIVRKDTGRGAWKVKCECGRDKYVYSSELVKGKVKSCGCYRKQKRTELNTKHGHAKLQSSEYRIWKHIKERCTNPKCKEYKYYGGRNITIDDTWIDSFETFYKDKGRKPGPGYSIDRIDTNGNYTPENTRWATSKEQNRNKRNNVYLDTEYGKMLYKDAIKKYRVSPSSMHYKMKTHNLSHQDAFQEIILKTGGW